MRSIRQRGSLHWKNIGRYGSGFSMHWNAAKSFFRLGEIDLEKKMFPRARDKFATSFNISTALNNKRRCRSPETAEKLHSMIYNSALFYGLAELERDYSLFRHSSGKGRIGLDTALLSLDMLREDCELEILCLDDDSYIRQFNLWINMRKKEIIDYCRKNDLSDHLEYRIKVLQKEMQDAAQEEDYIKAAQKRDSMDGIKHILRQRKSSPDYL